MMTNNSGGGGVERGTHDLILQHVRVDTPTPFKPSEDTLGRIGMTGAGIDDSSVTEALPPVSEASVTAVVPGQDTGSRISGILRLFASVSDKFVRHK